MSSHDLEIEDEINGVFLPKLLFNAYLVFGLVGYNASFFCR